MQFLVKKNEAFYSKFAQKFIFWEVYDFVLLFLGVYRQA